MSLTVDLDLTKFEAIVEGTSFDVSNLATFAIPPAEEYPKPTYTFGAPPAGAYVTSATIKSVVLTNGGITYSATPDMFFPDVPMPRRSTTKGFTFEDFERALHEVVEEQGRQYHYPRGMAGVYRWKDGRSACLIGMVLDRLDRSMLDSLPTGTNGGADMMIGYALGGYFDAKDVGRIAYAARAAQVAQDSFRPWGYAEAEFHRAARMVPAR